MIQYIPVIILMLVGALIIGAAVKDWDAFFESRKAARLVRLIGRQAARIFYGVLGAIMCGMSVYMVVMTFTGAAV